VLRSDCIDGARELDHDALAALLSDPDPETTARFAAEADEVMRREVGDTVYLRGLVEFSNHCRLDCYYCGIRRSNTSVERYCLTRKEVVAAARRCAEAGFGSLTLQSGERRDEAFVHFVCDLVREVKQATRGPGLPDGLGITLSVGEQSAEAYRRFREEGAHRYLLRIETSSPALFARIHPPAQRFDGRLAALRRVRSAGFQVGTGVMIGLPGQTADDLAEDIRFYAAEDIDMIGMGPYLPEDSTPMGRGRAVRDAERDRLFHLSLRMIALTRIVLRDVNIAATTALQTLHPEGRTRALSGGANVVMPILTPPGVRARYALYEGKAGVDSVDTGEIAASGRPVGFDSFGDAPHARHRLETPARGTGVSAAGPDAGARRRAERGGTDE
jgi:biotin synthase